METRRLKVVAKTDFCDNGIHCPTVLETEQGTYLVQGKKIDAASRRSVEELAGEAMPGDEDVVEIPVELIRQLARDLNV